MYDLVIKLSYLFAKIQDIFSITLGTLLGPILFCDVGSMDDFLDVAKYCV